MCCQDETIYKMLKQCGGMHHFYLWYLCGFSFQSADTQVLSGSLGELWQSVFHPVHLVPTRWTDQLQGTVHFKWRKKTLHICDIFGTVKMEFKSNYSFILFWHRLTKSKADPPPKYSIIIHNFVPWNWNQQFSQIVFKLQLTLQTQFTLTKSNRKM